eukprot:2966719-Rhodomonas_salina.1
MLCGVGRELRLKILWIVVDTPRKQRQKPQFQYNLYHECRANSRGAGDEFVVGTECLRGLEPRLFSRSGAALCEYTPTSNTRNRKFSTFCTRDAVSCI